MRLSSRTAFALIATVAVVGSAVAVIWVIHSSKNPVDTATVYAGYLAAAAIAVTLLMAIGGWWWKGRQRSAAGVSTPRQVAAAADRLADLMTAKWRQEATARRIITPAPATVRWRWAAEGVAAPRAEVIRVPTPGTGPAPFADFEEPGELLESGVVARLHDEVYARLPHGRLVLLGGPGAGKTGAMILLLLAGLDKRASLGGEQRAKVPVPVWLTLGGWDPAVASLHQWAADMMNRDHPALGAAEYGPDTAGELLRVGRVALFLDGLDEMPEGLRARALRRVDEEARGLRVVVTSRPDEYRGAVQSGGPGNTAVIELRPVRPNAAATYLQHGQTGLSRRHWEEVGDYLKRNPDSVAARALDNPLNLSLARDSYTTRDPTVLIDPGKFPTEDALREHLIDQLLVTAYPDERQRAQVTRWLAWIAHQMGSSRDLPWWEISTWIPQWKLHAVRGLAVALAVGGTTAFAASHLVGLAVGHVHGPVAPITAGLALGVGAGVVAELGAGLRHPPRTLIPRWPRTRQMAWILQVSLGLGLLVGLGVGLGGALAAGLVSSSLARAGSGFIVGFVVGAVFGGVVGLALGFRGLWGTPIAGSPSASATTTYRADLRTSVIAGLMVGLAGGLAAGLAAGLKFGPTFGFEAAVVFGLGAGLPIWLLVAQVPLVKLTELVLACQGSGRVHFLRLLDEAFSRQVLRQAGAVYQFRHAALQDRLAETYSQPSADYVSLPSSVQSKHGTVRDNRS
ncbi:MAG TPA: hypothetical protein VHZ03_27960 [Trebonia sp.]|nr:hypothetical protein [Trebonia sp.]